MVVATKKKSTSRPPAEPPAEPEQLWETYSGNRKFFAEQCYSGLAALMGVSKGMIADSFKRRAAQALNRHWPVLCRSAFRRQILETPAMTPVRTVPVGAQCHWKQVLYLHDLLATMEYDLRDVESDKKPR